jgi:hypothetical protein
MNKVFVSGSMRIKKLDREVLARLDNTVESNLQIIVGDADGVDTSIQTYLYEKGSKSVVVYCSGDRPRNNIGHWVVERIVSMAKPGTRAFFTEKDKRMARDCDYGLMVWDTKSMGTLSNALELVKESKPALVYINKAKIFLKVKEVSDVERLISYMSDSARQKADQKIRLSNQIDAMKHVQASMF